MRMIVIAVVVVFQVAAGTALADDWFRVSSATPGESFARGQADLLRGAGQCARDVAAARIAQAQAARQAMLDKPAMVRAYFEARMENRNGRRALEGPKPTAEKLARWAREAAPARLTSYAIEPSIRWPGVLQDSEFADCRSQLETLFQDRSPENSGLVSLNHLEVCRVVDEAQQLLKAKIYSVPPSSYVVAKRFLQSLAYESRFPVTAPALFQSVSVEVPHQR